MKVYKKKEVISSYYYYLLLESKPKEMMKLLKWQMLRVFLILSSYNSLNSFLLHLLYILSNMCLILTEKLQ